MVGLVLSCVFVPLKAIRVWHSLGWRWLAFGGVPTQLTQIRQVNLPKSKNRWEWSLVCPGSASHKYFKCLLVTLVVGFHYWWADPSLGGPKLGFLQTSIILEPMDLTILDVSAPRSFFKMLTWKVSISVAWTIRKLTIEWTLKSLFGSSVAWLAAGFSSGSVVCSGQLPTAAASSGLWSRGDGKCYVANKHVRAWFFGGNFHPELLSATHLLGAVASSTDRTLACWNGPVGSPVRLLRQVLHDFGLSQFVLGYFLSHCSKSQSLIPLSNHARPWLSLSPFDQVARISQLWKTRIWRNQKFFVRPLGGLPLYSISKHAKLDILQSSCPGNGSIFPFLVQLGYAYPLVSLNHVCMWQCGEYDPGFYHAAWGCPCHPHLLEPPDSILFA